MPSCALQPINYNISHKRELKNIKNAKQGDFATIKNKRSNGIREMVYEFDGNDWCIIDGIRHTETVPDHIDTLQVRNLSELYEMDDSIISKYDLILYKVDDNTFKIYKYGRKIKKLIYIGTRTFTSTVTSKKYADMINEMLKRSKIAYAIDLMSGVHNIFYDFKDLDKIEDPKENDDAVVIVKSPSHKDTINTTKFRFTDNSWVAIGFDQCKTDLEIEDFINIVNAIRNE